MLAPVAAALLFLALLVPGWRWLEVENNLLDGWMFSAYAVLFAVLAAYRARLDARGEDALRAAFGRGGGMPRRRSPWIALLDQLALSATAVGLVLALVYAPQEKTMGQVQRIFYVHVPAAWAAGLAYTVVCLASVMVLARRSDAADRTARASAEVGVVFTSLVLLTGPIWARPVWGIWWTWDARLTTTLLLWLVYVGYLMLRALVPDAVRQKRLGAVVGILGFIGVVVDYMAIRWWRTQHPQPVIAGGEGSGLAPAMLKAFLVMLVAMTLAYLALLWRRLEIARLEDDDEAAARRRAG